VFRPPTKTKSGVFCILEFKLMSDVTDQHLGRSRQKVTEDQYDSLRSDLSKTIEHQGSMVNRISFITGTRSLNEEDLTEFFKVLLIGGLTYQVNTSIVSSIVWALVSDSVVEFAHTPGVSISLINSLYVFVLMYVLVSTDVSPQ
jgi:hypothetical protein